MFFAPALDTRCGIQPEGAAACEDNRVDCFYQGSWSQKVGFAGPGRRSPDIDSAHSALLAEHDRAAGNRVAVRPVAGLDPSYVSDRVVVGQELEVVDLKVGEDQVRGGARGRVDRVYDACHYRFLG